MLWKPGRLFLQRGSRTTTPTCSPEVEGCARAYEVLAQQIPLSCPELLDLGCGTGLELDAVFRRLPKVRVTEIDLTQAMLERCRAKYPHKALRLIRGNYLKTSFGHAAYDGVIAAESFHHLDAETKTSLYRRVPASLKPGGFYIECDYMVETQEEETRFFLERIRACREHGVT